MLVGLILGRRIVQVPTLVDMDTEALVQLVSPAVQALLVPVHGRRERTRPPGSGNDPG